MARHPAGTRGTRGRNQNLVYAVVTGAAFVVVIALIYGFNPFKKKPQATPPDYNAPTVAGPNTPGTPTVPVAEPNEKEPPRKEPNAPRISAGAETPAADPEAAALIADAIQLLNTDPGRVIEARDMLNKALKMHLGPRQRAQVKTRMARLSEQWLFSKSFFPGDRLCTGYRVQPGDRLSDIGRANRVPYQLLMRINNIRRPEALRAGERIKIVKGPFHVKVYRSSFTMDVFLQDTYVKSFPVGLGAPGRQTPTGLWHIKPGGKLPHPIYTDPDTGQVIHPEDPNYPLGSRWMELEGLDENTKHETGFGIHGTKDPDSIGKASSRGCIRLHNGDAIEVYDLLVESHSLVKILE